MMANKWFDRKWDFHLGAGHYCPLLCRLQNTPKELVEITGTVSVSDSALKPSNKWSVNENVGHLLLLEPLWRKRFQEIVERKPEISPADLSNTATGTANFNAVSLKKLSNDFFSERNETITFLDRLGKEDLLCSSIHPRLQQPMSVIDLMYFVAEHDQHHLNTILNMINGQK